MLLLCLALLLQLKFLRRPGESATTTEVVSNRTRSVSSPAYHSPAPPHVAGRWEMQIQKTKGGVQRWTLTLEQSGEVLRGVINSEGGDLPITGTIQGEALKFSATRFGVTVEFDATIDGDGAMSGRMKVLTVDRRWTAKRL